MSIESKAKLFAALAKAQAEAEHVVKDAKNSHFGYAYATSEAIIDVAKTALNKQHLSVMPYESRQEALPSGLSENDGKAISVLARPLMMHSSYLLAHDSGESVVLQAHPWAIVPERGRPINTAVAVAATVQLAYFLRDLLLLPRVTKEEADARERSDRQREREEIDTTTGEVKEKPVAGIKTVVATTTVTTPVPLGGGGIVFKTQQQADREAMAKERVVETKPGARTVEQIDADIADMMGKPATESPPPAAAPTTPTATPAAPAFGPSSAAPVAAASSQPAAPAQPAPTSASSAPSSAPVGDANMEARQTAAARKLGESSKAWQASGKPRDEFIALVNSFVGKDIFPGGVCKKAYLTPDVIEKLEKLDTGVTVAA